MRDRPGCRAKPNERLSLGFGDTLDRTRCSTGWASSLTACREVPNRPGSLELKVPRVFSVNGTSKRALT
jgi:hypothetical protein